MPSYAWTCFVCEKVSPADTEACVHCGFSACASGRDIAAARQSTRPEPPRSPIVPSVSAPAKTAPPLNGAHGLLFLSFGALCLAGAFVALSTGHWPAFMPPQLDLFAVPLALLSERLGAVVGGLIAGVVGLSCVVLAVAVFRKSNGT